ncbi:DNA (cytosine-5)-methyltransferase 3-like isoform X3 [Camelus ferus]|uniref:DNA (Cytosine-5)-methyltransferase 3-like isoform X3 n=1 Tax=Camelus ferus TaxID=419612 RepID=A0A8B8U6P3_CAMFR|nr:DNA (cytosine-5)-methyltransferase 3-like isoform X3 [Camelus ferus]
MAAALVVDLEAEHSMDVILVGSSELSSPPSPRSRRDLVAYEVQVNQRDIEDMCICCGSFQVHTQHPLFEGGMCAPCKDKFLECLFLYDDDGYQSYCSICCAGETLLICENPDCTRCYCFECVDTLVGPGTSGRVHAMSNWVCFLCLPFPRSGLLQRRRKWRGWLKAFYDREAKSPLEMYKTVPVWKREPVRVLSLFGDIKKELTSLGFLESGSGPGRLRHLDDVTDVVRRDVEEWGPFDLTYGSTPPLGHTCDHPPAPATSPSSPGCRCFPGRRDQDPDGPRDHPARPRQDHPERRARVEQHPRREEQALGPGFPRGISPAGPGQAESEAPRPGASRAGEELFPPLERIFQVFFNRAHFLFTNESLYCENSNKKRLFLEQR